MQHCLRAGRFPSVCHRRSTVLVWRQWELVEVSLLWLACLSMTLWNAHSCSRAIPTCVLCSFLSWYVPTLPLGHFEMWPFSVSHFNFLQYIHTHTRTEFLASLPLKAGPEKDCPDWSGDVCIALLGDLAIEWPKTISLSLAWQVTQG